ncbi:hypothetical protein J2W23_000554 [Variovorax boronicumulans]|uniref:hypothetical protein n=1 Tax=Variovorax boronicumulans TaxID=436515 RepID=UPI00159DF793|nr:hypothetical protein [Variovorax boronicumulans]MDQ0012190.1 hypothetical protein [Variovorax boronicumulans]
MFSQVFRKKFHLRAVLGGVAAASLFPLGAHATQATADFTVTLPVNAPKCTVSTSSPAIELPKAGSAVQTTKGYMAFAGFTEKSPTDNNYFGSSQVQQLATITCDTAATPINSILIKPTGSAIKSTGFTYLTDAKGNKAADGKLYMGFEQLQVNNKDTYFFYNDEKPYKPDNAFLTENVANGTATVSWRPVLRRDDDNAVMRAPEGGVYSATGTIIVNY